MRAKRQEGKSESQDEKPQETRKKASSERNEATSDDFYVEINSSVPTGKPLQTTVICLQIAYRATMVREHS